MKTLRIVWGLLLLSVFAQAAEKETVRFGVSLSLSGDFADIGASYLAGVAMRLEEFNANAEANEFALEMVLRDDRSDPDVARGLFLELADQERVVAVIGPNTTDIAVAIRDLAEEKRLPLISPSVTTPLLGKGGGWTFRVLYDDDFEGFALARFMREKLGPKKAAVLFNSRFSYGANIYRTFREMFEEMGGEIVYEGTYDADLETASTMDFAKMLEEARLADPDIMLLPNYAVEVASIIHESLGVEFRNQLGLPIRFCGGDTWNHDRILLESGNNLNDSYFVGVVDEEVMTPETVSFINHLNQSHDIDAEISSVLGYDAMSLLIEALKTGHSREAVREGMYAIRDFPLASGRITIDRERGTLKPAFIIRIRRRGEHFVRELVSIIEP